MDHRTHVGISALIAIVLGLHAAPVLQRFHGDPQTLWPFLSWAMYRGSRPPGPVETVIGSATGITAQGREIPVLGEFEGLEDLGGVERVSLDRYPLRSLWADGDPTIVRRLADRLNAGRSDPIVELRLRSTTYTITAAGVAKTEHPVAIYRIADPEAGVDPGLQ